MLFESLHKVKKKVEPFSNDFELDELGSGSPDTISPFTTPSSHTSLVPKNGHRWSLTNVVILEAQTKGGNTQKTATEKEFISVKESVFTIFIF